MSKVQTRISIESSERLTVKRKRYSIRAWCEDCSRTSIMTLPSEAAFLACQDIDLIIYLIYTNQLHVRNVGKRGLFVCLTSLCMQPFGDELINSINDTEFELIEVDADFPVRNSLS